MGAEKVLFFISYPVFSPSSVLSDSFLSTPLFAGRFSRSFRAVPATSPLLRAALNPPPHVCNRFSFSPIPAVRIASKTVFPVRDRNCSNNSFNTVCPYGVSGICRGCHARLIEASLIIYEPDRVFYASSIGPSRHYAFQCGFRVLLVFYTFIPPWNDRGQKTAQTVPTAQTAQAAQTAQTAKTV